MNSINIVGRLTRDPEFKTFNSKGVEKELAKFRVAVNRPGTYGDNQKADFFNVVTYFSAAFCKHLGKGRLVSVSGMMTYNEYEKDGAKIANYEIVADNISALDKSQENSVVSEVQVAPANTAAPQTRRVEYASDADANVY